MSSIGVNFSGLASGLDTRAIIDALVGVERRPISLMTERQKGLRSRKNLFADLDGLLDKLQTASNTLRNAGDFLDFKVAVDKDDYLSATASSSAQSGAWDVEVVSLARAKVVTSNGRADRDVTEYGDGTLLFNVGGQTRQVTIPVNATTLDGIANAINGADIDIQAQVLDTGQAGNQRYKLVFSGTKTGAANSFSVTVDDGRPELTTLISEMQLVGNQVSAATDANLKVNGVPISRTTNTITDAITGVTLDLKAAAANQLTRVTVSTDSTKTAEKVKGFVDAYNSVVDFIAAQNVVDDKGNTKAPLFGDVTLRSVKSSLRGIMGASVDTGNTAYALLSQVGVTSDRDGKLTLDSAKLERAILADEDAVENLFADAPRGIAVKIKDQIDVYTDSVEGLFKTRNDGFDRQIKDFDSRIATAERRLEAYEKQLESRFAAMETLVGRLQGQGGALSAVNNRNANR